MRARWTTSLLLTACCALGSCNVAGPAALNSGRAVYNAVINATEDEQVLAMLVRRRYDETFGMLAVGSVTANITVGARVGSNVGFGPSADYAGNLVPLSGALTYEENPTISYVPMRGEEFMTRMLAPITLEQALLLGRATTENAEVLRLVVRRINGIGNPMFGDGADRERFDSFVRLYAALRDAGFARVMRTEDNRPVLALHRMPSERRADARALLDLLGIDTPVATDEPTVVPLRLAVGTPSRTEIQIETPSALEAITAIADGVRAPEEHLREGLARPASDGVESALVRIESSRQRPKEALIAVQHRGWWFSIDSRDTASKQGFMLLRILIGMRLDQNDAGSHAPLLTLPVGG